MKKLFTIVFAVLTMSTAIFAQERIAVFPFEDMENIFTRNESTLFYREFSNEFTNRSGTNFHVVPRQEIEKFINTEAAFQLSDFSAREKTAEMQRVLNGTQILSGLIGKLGNNIRITVSLYTYPELRQLPGGVTVSVSNKNELFAKIPELVQQMQNEIAEGNIYKIGDTGPAGGIIFYDKGNNIDGWRYLEAAPSDLIATDGGEDIHRVWETWEPRDDVLGTKTGIGTGKRNTEIIILNSSQGVFWYLSGKAPSDYFLNPSGYDDWFLPSIDELELMYKNLKRNFLGNFDDSPYWSSSQFNKDNVWVINFKDGTKLNIWKGQFTTYTRYIRAF